MPEPIFGVDYYPEHWPEDRWPLDAELMREAGLNTARLAEFAWSRLEPREGAFDFAWLDRAIAVLSARGLRIVLSTPTAAPPAWLVQAYPEILPVNEDGQRAGFGQRRHYCPTQPAFHLATRRIVEAMTAHYRAHPAVFAWQIDNEFGNIPNGARCHCPSCRDAFQSWLRDRYESLEVMNVRWGTVFWSQEYTAWDQIPVPLRNVRAHNPSLTLDFARFTSEMWVRYQRIQVDILRRRCPGHLLTHNMMGLFPYVDAAALAQDLDVVAWDNYPRMPAAWSAEVDGLYSPSRVAMAHDLMRGAKGRTFWVMEQQAGPSGWGTLSSTPLPGEIRLWTLQAVARGAEAIVYFNWRSCRVGAEQYWHGILPHDGGVGRRYDEVRRTGEDLRRLAPLAAAPLPADVALLRSYDALWALETQPGTRDLSYDDQIGRVYRALWRRNVPTDLITEDRPWDRYKVLIAPCLFVLRPDVAARLRSWVRAGGTLVLTFRSGVKDAWNAVVDAPLPGLLSDLVGARVTDYTIVPADCVGQLSVEVVDLASRGDALSIGVGVWMDELEVDTADILGHYRGGPYEGAPAITRNDVGTGRVFYVGTSLDDAGQDLLMSAALAEAGVDPGILTPEDIEIVRRADQGNEYLFILNYGEVKREVLLPGEGVDVLTGRPTAARVTIPARDAVVVRRDSGRSRGSGSVGGGSAR